MPQQTEVVNAITVAAELVLVLVVFAIVSALAKRALRRVAATESLERFKSVAESIQRRLGFLIRALGGLVFLGVAGFNGYLWWRGEVLHEAQLALLRDVPREVWITLAVGLGKTVGLAIFVAWVLKQLKGALAAACARAKAWQGLVANDDSIQILFDRLTSTVIRLSWLGVLYFGALWMGLPDAVCTGVLKLTEVVAIISGGLVLWHLVDAAIASVDALTKEYAESHDLAQFYKALKPMTPLLRRAVEYVIYVGAATLVTATINLQTLSEFGPRIIRTIGALFLARVAVELISLILRELVIERPRLTADAKNRRLTILPLFESILKYGVYFSTGIYVLKQFDVDPTPILAGAGIAAMAVGLGAQNLINDMVNGFFILFENYFLVGDFVEAGGAVGVVEQIDLRTTRIRDSAGRVHIVRNGSIENVVNYSKEFAYAVIEVGVGYESDLDHVRMAVDKAATALEALTEDTLSPLVLEGLESFGGSELALVLRAKVKPGKHIPVARLARKCVKEVFDAEGIDIPYAHQILMFKDEDGNQVGPQSFATPANQVATA